jgi:hypothetical protein
MTFTVNQIQSLATNTLEVDKTTPNAGAGFTDATGVGTETHSVTIEDKGASPSGYNSLEDASDYNQSFDPTGVSDPTLTPTGLYSPTAYCLTQLERYPPQRYPPQIYLMFMTFTMNQLQTH